MKEICAKLQCTGCGACMQACPNQCITMKPSEEGFLYPFIDQNQCINCGLCRNVCPEHLELPRYAPDFSMAWHKDEEILMQSSSGGAFTALAQWILQKNGCIVGAALIPDTREVRHVMVDCEKGLGILRLSKYYQSTMGNIYQMVIDQLKGQRYVLFSGTACQIAGLLSLCSRFAAGESQKYLFTVDVLCHGVASKHLVDAYVKEQEKMHQKAIDQIFFRTKSGEKGWNDGNGTRMRLRFEDQSLFEESLDSDMFFIGFNQNLFLRESCYRCKYCGVQRISDFTIADFWGVRKEKVPEEQLKKGISLLLFNSERAKGMRNELNRLMTITEIEPDEAIPFNRALRDPNPRPKQRNKFYKKMYSVGFQTAVRRSCPRFFLLKKIKKTAKKILGEKWYFRLKKAVKGTE